jgi:23S rRNA (adenine2503-C2)-methyltransferase
VIAISSERDPSTAERVLTIERLSVGRVSSQAEPASLLDLSPSEVVERLSQMGEPGYRARQLLGWIYRDLVFDYERMTTLPKELRASLAASLPVLPLAARAEVASDEGLTRKALLELRAGSAVETVLMSYPARAGRGETEASRARRTVCVSSQVGCGVGCPFCATGQSGLLRNLSAGEIVGQVLHFSRRVRDLEDSSARITNVVFMGQGEPLANFRAVWKAVEILNSPDALGLGARHVMISTSGLVPRIRELAEKPLQVGLAISLHAPEDELRDRLVPVNRKYPLAELMDACRYYVQKTNRRVSFEYVMLDGVNDSLEQAATLARLLRGFLGHVNLIPMNPVAESEYQPTPWKRVLAFEESLRRAGVPCTVRIERGDPIDAACGQLRARILGPSGE